MLTITCDNAPKSVTDKCNKRCALCPYSKAEETQSQSNTTLKAVLEMFKINLLALDQEEIEALRFTVQVCGYTYNNGKYDCFNRFKKQEINHMSISDIVCDMVAMSLASWSHSDVSFVKESSCCRIDVNFLECINTLTGESWTMEEQDLEETVMSFAFNRKVAKTYLFNHLSSIRDESAETYSWLVFEDDHKGLITYKIIQGSEHY